MVASGHSATAKQYLKVLRSGIIKDPGPAAMQKHGIVATGDGTYESME